MEIQRHKVTESLDNQLIIHHSRHIRLDDGFHLTFHISRNLWFLRQEIVFEQEVGAEAVESLGFLTVKLQEPVAFYVLVYAV